MFIAAFAMRSQSGKPNIHQEENESANCDIFRHEIILDRKREEWSNMGESRRYDTILSERSQTPKSLHCMTSFI